MPRDARHFLAPSSDAIYVAAPPRELPEVADEPSTVERIRDAASIRDEPEAVSSAWANGRPWLRENAKDARRRHTEHRTADVGQRRVIRDQLDMEDRMKDAQRRAKRHHVDVSHELHVLGKMLERARNGGRKEPPSAVKRMAKLEARLDELS